jgi:hypothetical protein
MAAQRHFIQHGPPEDTVLYFIPCLSPTMCFADARGIPNEFWMNSPKTSPSRHRRVEEEVKVLDILLGKFVLKPDLTIPKLHDALIEGVKEDVEVANGVWERQEVSMRTAIQRYNDMPLAPKHGVDANRDYYFSLPSSQYFLDFIKNLKQKTAIGKTRTTTVISGREFNNATLDNMRVFMMHGYDGSGAVYGPYSVFEKGENEPWPARMNDDIDIPYVNNLMNILKMPTWNQREGSPLYADTGSDARPYRGEWSRHLYELEIWGADIELANNNNRFSVPSYNEGIHGGSYNPALIGEKELPYFKEQDNGFYDLLKDFPWR